VTIRALLAGIAVLCGIATPGAAAPPPAPHPPETGRGAWLVARLIEIANAGVLLEPAKVGRILGLNFDARPPAAAPPVECKPPERTVITVGGPLPFEKSWYDAVPGVTRHVPVGDDWYRATPEGQAPATIEDPGTKQPLVLGDPQINYATIAQGDCSGRNLPKAYTVADLEFRNVSGFACVTRQQLETLVPQRGMQRPSSSSASGIAYSANFDDDEPTSVSFVFAPGTDCMVKAQMMQSPIGGHRYLQAMGDLFRCTEEAGTKFRNRHAPFDPKDPTLARQYRDEVQQFCGTFDDHYRGTPRSHPK
jgi:hypothetical protein